MSDAVPTKASDSRFTECREMDSTGKGEDEDTEIMLPYDEDEDEDEGEVPCPRGPRGGGMGETADRGSKRVRGHIDDAETLMRELGASGLGRPDRDGAYDVARELQHQRDTVRSLKRALLALSALTALLAISNAGSIIVAARLSGDRAAVDSRGSLREERTGEEVSTVSTGTVVRVSLGTSAGGSPSEVGRLQGEPLDLWCDAWAGYAGREDVTAAGENIGKGAQSLSINLESIDEGGAVVVSNFFINVINAHRTDDLLQIEFTRLIPCPPGDEGCEPASWRLAPEHMQFECGDGEEICDVYSCSNAEALPVGGGGGGLD